MGYLNETLKRVNVQSLREYLLCGTEGGEYSTENYEERLKKAYGRWRDIVKEYDSDGEDSELFRVINNVLAEHENVYMEMGIQAGFRLARGLEEEQDSREQFQGYKNMYTSLFKEVTEVIEKLQKAQNVAEDIYIFQ